MADDGLPTRAQDLADAWRCSRRALLDGSMGSLEALRERRLIVREAKEEGVLDELVAIVTGDSGPPPIVTADSGPPQSRYHTAWDGFCARCGGHCHC
tara:strand:+ start:13440 stop:13730 length:291 start_codon:yes stop_codon:yes gene_type:complete